MLEKFANWAGRLPFTIAVVAAACLVHAIFGAGAFPAPPDILPRLFTAFANVLRHGDAMHLLGNVVLMAVAGSAVEPRIPRGAYLKLIGLSALMATTVEFTLSDRAFVGLSGVCLGVGVFAVLRWAGRVQTILWLVLIVAALVAEVLFAGDALAVFAHAGGAAAGVLFAMFNKLFGQKGPRLIPMEARHHAHVLGIIEETDEDDAAEAHEHLQADGYDGMFVLVDGSDVLGVTGAHLADNSDDVAWLSWTYLTQHTQGQGLGQVMLDGLLGQLNDHGVRKIFIATSDYAEDGEQIYADAMDFYRSLGAAEEMRVPDYHDDGEAKIVFGLINPGIEAGPAPQEDPVTGVRFSRATPAPESEGGLGLDWDLTGNGVDGLDAALDAARRQGARMVFVALPSDASHIAAGALEAAGMTRQGRLKDYYAIGIDDVWWSKPMT